MFLIIFGLRGYKHELESKMGLRCAAEVHETFQTWSEIVTVSIGVSSGMSYCGVVGHTLRREYSVISVNVNKAARLMMAYPNVVSCDQDTFLYSKVDLKHFSLLPKKTLKGLRDEVVAYKFKEAYEELVMEYPLSYNYPLIGRNDIISKSQQLLMKAITNFNRDMKQLQPLMPKISCFLIKDDLQQGKTRIIDEFHSQCFFNKLKCIRLTLNNKHSKLPYILIATIVKEALTRDGDSSPQTLERLIRNCFDGLGVEDFLSLLNPIFEVDFDVAEITKVMTTSELAEISKIMFKILCTHAFQEFTVVLIDDLEYADQQSLELFGSLLETSAVFTFITIGQQKKLTNEHKALEKAIFSQNYVSHYQLGPIELVYHNQLACQFLNVSAVSLDFENYLQKESEGNPGWIEVNSIALVRSNKVQIKSMTVADVHRQGMTMFESIFVPENLTAESICNEHFIFNQCYDDGDSIQEDQDQQKMVKVALLDNAEICNEFMLSTTTDSYLLIYDSLTYYEQLVCKCGSVLGIEFTRHMMFFVLSSSTHRMIGKALVKLFDLQIFVCASTTNNSSQDSALNQKSPGESISCNCKDVTIFESCRDLPRYSCCEILKFRAEGFRAVVYDSLTDKQRSEYHRRSMVYLQMETKKCDSCGNGQFKNLMLMDSRFRDGILELKDSSFESMVAFYKSINLPVKQPVKKSFIRKSIPFVNTKETRIPPVVLNYMNYDFRSCKCSLILYSMYSEMIEHCHGGETILKLIDIKIELASMCIKVSNITRASGLLHKALKKLSVS